MATYKQSDYKALRRRCIELKQTGWKQQAIAQTFGLNQGWVSWTLTKYQQQGTAGLQEGKRTGAPARLSSQQLADLGHSTSDRRESTYLEQPDQKNHPSAHWILTVDQVVEIEVDEM